MVQLLRVTSPRSSPTGRGTRTCFASEMGLDSYCKRTTTSTRTASLCWTSSLTRFQPQLWTGSTAVSTLFLLALCRLTSPPINHSSVTGSMSAIGMFRHLRKGRRQGSGPTSRLPTTTRKSPGVPSSPAWLSPSINDTGLCSGVRCRIRCTRQWRPRCPIIRLC